MVIIGDMFVDQLREAGVLETFDSSKLSNISGIYENARAPMGEGHGTAYTFNRLGIVYDSAFCDVEIKSIADLWNPELAGSIAVPEMTTTSGPLFYYATAAAFGLEPGKDDEAIFAKLAELKPNVVKTWTSANDTINMLNQGEISVAVLLDYSYTTAKNANPDYIWVDPAEGSFSGYNMLNIVKGCENKELAEAFIDYYLSYDVQLAEALDGVDAPVQPGRRADRRAGCQLHLWRGHDREPQAAGLERDRRQSGELDCKLERHLLCEVSENSLDREGGFSPDEKEQTAVSGDDTGLSAIRN